MSKKHTPPMPEELEKELQDYYASPEPRPEFISRLERGLHSKFKEQEQKRMFGNSKKKLAWGFGLALAAVLIGLLVTSPTVVAAMKRLLGYISGVGLVESESPIRILAEPVAQTRDGITITVKEAVLSSDKTVITFTVENIPFDKLSHGEDVPVCAIPQELRLPDGSIVQSVSGNATGWGSGYEYHLTYASIPADVNEATLLVPCIQDVLPGVLPENWELPIRFIPAPLGFTVAPVTEIAPSQEPTAAAENPLTLTKVVETENGYILIGEFNSAHLSKDMNVTAYPASPRIFDADGSEIPYTIPPELEQYSVMNGITPWAAQLNEKSFRWPLKIVVDTVDTDAPDLHTEFDFDAGANPQPGQVWEPKQEIQLGQYSVVLESVSFSGTGYTFKFQAKDDLQIMSIEIVGYAAVGSGGGGTGQGDSELTLDYAGTPPTGLLKIRFGMVMIRINGPWTLEWQPDDATILNLPTPTTAPQACLTVDAWQAAFANPMPLPASLTGKVISYGRIIEDGQNPSPENYGVFVANLDGSNKQVIGQGVWPSLSPDGTRAAYAWEQGLYIADLATGESHLIPNTNGNDYNPRWSPDGTRLAFIRIDDFNLYLINPDGTGLQRVTSGNEYEELVDWTPDGTGLYYGANSSQGILLRKIDIASGAVSDFFTISSKGASFAVSPDGSRIAFSERVGEFSYQLFISNLDGSDRKLIGDSGKWGVTNPRWSPDGKWLMVGIMSEDTAGEPVLGLVNLEGCQVIALPLEGEPYDWRP